jgi:hypothetical protein
MRALSAPCAWSEDWQRTWVARFDWASLGARYDEEIRRCWENATYAHGSKGQAR